MDNDERIAYLSGDTSASLSPAERFELDELRGVLSDPAVWAEPPSALQERIVDAIADAGKSQPLSPAARSARPDGPAGIATRTRRRPRWIPYAILGVAATVLLAVGLTIGLTGHQSKPVEYQAALAGTKLAPGASGQVTLTRTASGWKIHLHATGLPRRDNGTYYEAWLKSSAGVLVPIGTFNQFDDVTLWAGVPPSSYPTLTVTRQVANGDPASSGQVVLVGSTHRTH